MIAVVSRPIRIRETAAFLDANARFVRIEIVALQETNIVTCNDGHARITGERQTGLYTVLLTASRCADELKIVAITEDRLPTRQ